MKLFNKTYKVLSFAIVFVMTCTSVVFAENYIPSTPINNMAMYDTRYKERGVLCIGDETLELFKTNVFMGFDYIIEENATLARLKTKLKDVKKYRPSVVLFYLGPHDYLENTSIKEFKDKIIEYRDYVRAECNASIAFFSYLDYKESNGNPHSYKDYDEALKELAKEYRDIGYIDTRYAADTDMISDGKNYNKEYLFYVKYAVIDYLSDINNSKPKIVFVGDSRTVGLSVVNKEKNVEFIGVPAGKYLEFEKTMEIIIKKFYSDCKVVILYGINDIDKNGNTYVEKYIDYLNNHHNEFFSKKMELYIATVMEQEDLVNIITFPRNYTLYTRNGALNYLDNHIHIIDLYTYMFIITAKLGKDKVFVDEIHFSDEASSLILEYLYDNIE